MRVLPVQKVALHRMVVAQAVSRFEQTAGTHVSLLPSTGSLSQSCPEKLMLRTEQDIFDPSVISTVHPPTMA